MYYKGETGISSAFRFLFLLLCEINFIYKILFLLQFHLLMLDYLGRLSSSLASLILVNFHMYFQEIKLKKKTFFAVSLRFGTQHGTKIIYLWYKYYIYVEQKLYMCVRNAARIELLPKHSSIYFDIYGIKSIDFISFIFIRSIY